MLFISPLIMPNTNFYKHCLNFSRKRIFIKGEKIFRLIYYVLQNIFLGLNLFWINIFSDLGKLYYSFNIFFAIIIGISSYFQMIFNTKINFIILLNFFFLSIYGLIITRKLIVKIDKAIKQYKVIKIFRFSQMILKSLKNGESKY